MKRDNFLLLFSQWVSAFGNHLHQLALPILVYQKTGAAADFALALMAETIPWVICAPFLSAYLQRWSGKRILLVSDISRAIICLVIAFASWSQAELFILMFLMGTFSSIYGAFRIQTVRKLIAKEQTTKFLGISNGGNEAIAMLAPIIGASLISMGVLSKYFMLIDGLTFLFSFTLLLLLPKVEPPPRLASERRVANPIITLRRLQLSSSIKVITLSEGIRAISEGLYIPAILSLLVQVNSFSTADYTWLRSCMAVAGVLGSYLFIKLEERWSHVKFHTVSTALIVIGIIVFPFVSRMPTALTMGLFIGFGMSFRQILADKLVITQSAERFQAETITFINSFVAGSYCLGYLGSVYWSAPHNIFEVFFVSGFLMAISLALGQLLRSAQVVNQEIYEG